MQYIHCEQKNKQLFFNHFNCYECRGINTEALIRQSLIKYSINKDLNFFVQTDDRNYPILAGYKLYNTVTDCKNYKQTFPDFFYHSWPEIHVPDYNTLITNLASVTLPFETNKIGWIGTLLCQKRIDLYNLSLRVPYLEVIPINWIRTQAVQLQAQHYLSYADQMKKWKYFIDIEGGGYSARLKVLLSLPRICFIVDRKYEEWYHQYLIPWETHIPVKHDLSDLTENYNIIEKDSKLQTYILNNQKHLFNCCLTRESALQQIRDILYEN
jgi:hypothetical protein